LVGLYKNIQELDKHTIQNSMIIFCTNSPGMKTDHLKFRVDLVQALLVEHGSGIERKVPGRHSTGKMMP
jgi:hypothetical protein